MMSLRHRPMAEVCTVPVLLAKYVTHLYPGPGELPHLPSAQIAYAAAADASLPPTATNQVNLLEKLCLRRN